MAINQTVMSHCSQKRGLRNEPQMRKWQWLMRIPFIIHREAQEMTLVRGMAMRKMSCGSLAQFPEQFPVVNFYLL